ncbi:hypothetical protein CHUAL_002145 [Chamberlinius hualienensis]
MDILQLMFFCTFPFLCNRYPMIQVINEKFDFIVVGGGSAGSVIASRLSENPNVKVLLLEAGDCQPFASEIPATCPQLLHSPYDWNFKSISQKNSFLAYSNNQTYCPRGKSLGGSSAINAMIYLRGNKNDYNDWAKMGNVGWSYDEVLPYFLKLEDMNVEELAKNLKYHNTKGPLSASYPPTKSKSLDSFLSAGEEMGYEIRDVNAEIQTDFMRLYFSMKDGTRCSAAKAYLLPAQNRPNLKILCNARVTKLLFGKDNEAVGVLYKKDNVEYTANASKEVILSAGSFQSPQLLMLSGIGPENQLQSFGIPVVANSPGVGENLHDHVGTTAMVWKVNCSDCTLHKSDQQSIWSLIEWLLFHKGIQFTFEY